MESVNKQTASQSQKLMVFVLTMALYGLATLFFRADPQVSGGHRGVFGGVFFVHSADAGNAV